MAATEGGLLMIPNFNNIFKRDPSVKQSIPAVVMEYLNSTIPDGTRYEADDEGNVTLIPDGMPMKISGFTIIPPKGTKEKLKTSQQILKYAYNAQTKIKIKPDEDGYLIVNGQKVALGKFHWNAVENIQYKYGECWLIPKPFPRLKDIIVGDGVFSRTLQLIRIPYPSLVESRFETKENQSLTLRFSINEETGENNFSLTYNLEYASSVQEIVETIAIFNAFIDGKGYLMGEILRISSKEGKKEKIDNGVKLFWEKILKLEKVLKIKFDPSVGEIDRTVISNVEQLYQNLIFKNPIREDQMFTSITLEDDADNAEGLKQSIGKEMYFQYNGSLKIEIFDQTIHCPSLFGMFNCKLKDVKREGKQTKLIFESVSNEKKGYTSVLSFASEEELLKYGTEVNDNHVVSLKDAKQVEEYLQEDEKN